MSQPLAPPARRRPSGRGLLALAGALLGASLLAGGGTALVAALAAPVVQDLGTPIERITIDGRVSILYPRGFDAGVDVSVMGNGFRWVQAGGYEDGDVRYLEIDNGDDTPDALWSVLLAGYPVTILGHSDGEEFLPERPNAAQFIAAAERDAQLEFEDGTVIGSGTYESLDVDVTESADGAPRVVATYTWPLHENETRWAGLGATAWQTVTSYTLDGDTVWRLSATGFLTDGPNETVRDVGTSLQWEGR